VPAELVPHEAIPDLAARVTDEQLQVLRTLQKRDYIRNKPGLDPKTVRALEELADLGLVDPANEGEADGPLYLWTMNSNGSRVLGFRTGIRGGPHYEVAATDLAAWLEEQGDATWWNVDGDPLLTGRIFFPCAAGKLAAELRRINRPLLVQAKKEDKNATGQPIGKEHLGKLVSCFADNVVTQDGDDLPAWSNDRLFYLCWKGSIIEWLLTEDGEAAELEAAGNTTQAG